jgi:hypothetical protein
LKCVSGSHDVAVDDDAVQFNSSDVSPQSFSPKSFFCL